MSKIELVSKKEKKLIAAIIAADNGNLETTEWKGVDNDKVALKQIKPLLKKDGLYKVEMPNDGLVIFSVTDRKAIDGTYHVHYWKTENIDNYGNALTILVNKLAEQDIKNLVIEFNKNDTNTIANFKNNNKIMIFEGAFYNTTTTDELGNDEWSSLEMPSFDEVFKEDADVEFKEYSTPTEPATGSNEAQAESEVATEAINEYAETVEQEAANVEQEAANVEQEQPQVEINDNVVEESETEVKVKTEEPKTDWAKEFYALRGDHQNGILSNEERFHNNRVQNAYAKSEEPLAKTDTSSLKTLRTSSDKVGQEMTEESTYEATRKMVLENLEKLRQINKNNNEEVKSTFKEKEVTSIGKKVSSDDLLNKINEIKAKCQSKQ